jgi:putative flippase GtrA
MSESGAGDRTRTGLAGFVPSGQFLRYLLVGGWNTVFGYGCFFLVNRSLATLMPEYSYLAASLISNLIAVSVAFLGYKWFVFRTRGNYLREWLRTLAIYSGSILVSTVALAPLVGLIRHFTRYQGQAPYIAAALIAVFTVASSFLGHRHFSFRKAPPQKDAPKDSALNA